MPYTENEINAKLNFLIEPEFKKAERFEQKPILDFLSTL